MEQERQRILQRKVFEEQMRTLAHQQAQELLNIPLDGNPISCTSHVAVSAPTTPPRINAHFHDEYMPISEASVIDANLFYHPVVNVQKSVSHLSHASKTNVLPGVSTVYGETSDGSSFSRTAGAKSMPASRRTSASSHGEEFNSKIHDSPIYSYTNTSHTAAITTRTALKYGDSSAGVERIMLDEQQNRDMHGQCL